MSFIRVVKYKPSFSSDGSIFNESFEVEAGFDCVMLTPEQLQSFQTEMVQCREMVLGAYRKARSLPMPPSAVVPKTEAPKALETNPFKSDGKITEIQRKAILEGYPKKGAIVDEHLKVFKLDKIDQLTEAQASNILKAMRRG